MITDLILSGAQALDDSEGFTIDRSQYLNASTAESCIRKQWFERHLPPVEQDWGYARRGKQGELYLVDCLLAAGAELAYAGEDQQSLVSKQHRISATPDGFLHDRDGWLALEFKTIDPRTNRNYLPKAAHVTQLQIGMELAHLQDDEFPHPFPHPVSGKIVYMDASNFNDILEFPVERDPEILDRLAPRAKKMLGAKAVDKLDREGKRSGECKAFGGCPFAEQCGIEIEGPATVSRGNAGSTLDAAVQAYVLAKADEDDAKARKASASEDIKTGLQSRNARELIVGNHRVSMTSVAGRRAYDWKAMQAAGIDLSPFMTTGKPSERLTVE
jgi:hypothetical protein